MAEIAGLEGGPGGRFGARLADLLDRALQHAMQDATRAFLAEQDRWILWSPVALGVGIAVYFGLPRESDVLIAWLSLGAILFAALLFSLRFIAPRVIGVGTLLILLGLWVADYRTASVAASHGSMKAGTYSVTGQVGSLGAFASGGQRHLLLHVSTEQQAIRGDLRLRGGEEFDHLWPGDWISVKAKLWPPPGPVEPGAFDFSRRAWFDLIGGVGVMLRPPEPIEPPDGISGVAGWRIALERIRFLLAKRIGESLEGPAGGIAAALITGDRSGIPEQIKEDLRITGLAHILAISGLHMALFAGSLFWAVRASLAVVPGFALRFSPKKWAALVAILGASIYLALSGASVATERAFVMIVLIFVSVLFDRPALTMRNVAIAAFLLLLWRPEGLVEASFQMSFAAVTALVAVYEAVRERELWALAPDGGTGWKRAITLYGGGLLLTSLVAGAASGIFAAYHFNRVADYGLLANLLAMPAMGFVIMPCALAAVLLLPLGLQGLALTPMGWGIDWVVAVAEMIAGWPGSSTVITSPPSTVLPMIVLGGLWLCVWRQTWRYLGLIAIGGGIIVWAVADRPDVIVARDGKSIAVRLDDGRLYVLPRPTRSYATETWLRRDADRRVPTEAKVPAGLFGCDALGCVVSVNNGRTLALTRSVAALRDDCMRSDIVIAMVPVRHACAADVVVDRFDLWRHGAHALWLRDGGILVTRAREDRDARPWHPG